MMVRFNGCARSLLLGLVVCLVSVGLFHGIARAAETMTLPEPDKQGGMPLMQALNERKTSRAFSDRPVDAQHLSNLLWATWGTNRADGRHTAPTAKNEQKILLFAALESGVWQYDPAGHSLTKVLDKDTRSIFQAPLTLLMAAPEDDPWGQMHVGSLYQNAGLYCASAGLANVVKGTGRDALDKDLQLPDRYKVLIIHSMGWPK